MNYYIFLNHFWQLRVLAKTTPNKHIQKIFNNKINGNILHLSFSHSLRTGFFVGQLQGEHVVSFSLNCGTKNKVWESEQRISPNNPHTHGNLQSSKCAENLIHSLPLCSWYSLHALWVHSKHRTTVQTLDVLKHTSEKKKGLYVLLPWSFMIWVLIAFLS